MNLKDKLLDYVLARRAKDVAKGEETDKRKELQEAMEDAGLDSIKTDEGPSCSLAVGTGVSYDKARMEELFAWLRALGHDDLIVTTVPTQGLAAVIRQMVEEGQEPKEGWPDFLDVSTYNTLRVRSNNYGK